MSTQYRRWKRPRTNGSRPGRPKGRARLGVEQLEDRLLPTTTLFLDFGEGFNGSLNMSVAALRDTLVGPQFRGDGSPALRDSTNLRFDPLRAVVANQNIDFNGRGAHGDEADYLALRDSILNLVRRHYAPFAVNVVVGNANSLADVTTAMGANAGDITGQFDAYVFVTGVVRTDTNEGLGADTELLGRASRRDLVDQRNNRDESVVVFADNFRGQQADGVQVPFDVAIASVASHEAGHTFGLVHTNAVFSADTGLLTDSDIMVEGGGSNRDMASVGFFSRFDLMEGGDNTDPTLVRNAYEQLVHDPDIGRRPGSPEYVTGTGAFDRITVSYAGPNRVHVFVEAFRERSFTNRLGTAFHANLDVSNGLVIWTGRGDDEVILDNALTTWISVDGGDGTDNLIIDDRDLGGFVDYVIDSGSVTRQLSFGSWGQYDHAYYSGVESLQVETSQWLTSTTRIGSTAAGVPVTVHSNANNLVTVGDGDLTRIAGPVTIHGAGNLTVNDQDQANTPDWDVHPTFTLSPNHLDYVLRAISTRFGTTFSWGATIVFDNVGVLLVNAGSANDVVNVEGSTPGIPVGLLTGNGDDIIRFAPTYGVMDSVQGYYWLNGGGGTNALIVNDQATRSRTTWTRTPASITRERFDGANQYRTQIDYSNMQNVVINGGSGANTLRGDAAGSAAPLTMILPVGGSGYDESFAVTTDAAGNVYTAGYFQGTVDFDPGPGVASLTATGLYDGYLAKYTSSGDLVWVKHLSSSTNAEAYGWDLRVDAANNVYLTGAFTGAMTLGTAVLTSAGGDDGYVAKLDSSGDVLWARQLAGTGEDVLSEVSVDAAGNVYVNGSFSDTATLAGRSFTSTGRSDGLVAKFNDVGVLQWAQAFTGAGDDSPWGIAVDAQGNVYTTGTFTDTVTIGSQTLTSRGDADGYLAKLNPSGQIQWVRQFGGTGHDFIGDVGVDAAGNVYTTGGFVGTMTLGDTTLTSKGGTDVFVTKLNSDGSFLWSRSMGSAADDWAGGLAVDAAGNTYYTGWFTGAGSFEGQATTAATYTGFLGKLDAAGNTVWTQVWGSGVGGTGGGWGYQVAIDGAGHIYVAGGFDGTADQDPGAGTFTMTSAGSWDAAVFQFTDTSTAPVTATAPDAGTSAAVTRTISITPAALLPDPLYPGQGALFVGGTVYADENEVGREEGNRYGGADDDLLVAGTTAFDANPAALGAILPEWTSDRGCLLQRPPWSRRCR
jgi:hypothetical protein